MSGIQVSRTKDGEALPIISPGESVGSVLLANSAQVLTTNKIQGTAVYIFCKSIIHYSEGLVSDDSAPIDARGGLYLDVNRGEQISVKLMEGEDPTRVWIHEVR